MEGKTIKLADGNDYVVQPLNLGLLEKYEIPLIDLTVANVATIYGSMIKSIPMLREGLNLNYPNLTDEDVKKLVNLKNFQPLLACLMGDLAVDKAAGESKPAPSSTGPTSTGA